MDRDATTPGGRRASPRTWWLSTRSGGSIALFRMALSLSLAGHYATHSFATTPLLRPRGLYDGGEVARALGVRLSPLAGGLSTAELHLVFGLGVVLAIGTAIGSVQRGCAVGLLLFGTLTEWALFPLSYVDDALACAASLFLVLLPAAGRGDARRILAGHAATVLLVMAIFLYASGAVGALSGAPPERSGAVVLASRLIAVALVAPGALSSTLGVAMQLALHAYLAKTTDAVFTQLALASTGILFWGERREATCPGESDGRRPIDAGAVAGLLYAGAFAVHLGVRALGGSAAADGSGRILADLGLLPVNVVAPPRSGGPVVNVRDGDDVHEVYDGDSSNVRTRLVAAQLLEFDASPLRDALATTVARRACGYGPRSRAVRRLVVTGRRSEKLVAQFQCGFEGDLSSIEPHYEPAAKD